LAAVITLFREGAVAWASDIEAMFSRFRLSIEDRDYFCFLWQEKDDIEPIVCRIDQLPFGASCSPFVAIYGVRRILKDTGPPDKVVRAVEEKMYVDDYLGSATSVTEAVEEAVTVLVRCRSQSPRMDLKFAGIFTGGVEDRSAGNSNTFRSSAHQ
jgi:hypothetical protein